MSSHLQDARDILARAQQVFNRALRQVDAKLRAAVAETPDSLEEARAIQAVYLYPGYTDAAALAPHVQPTSAPKSDNAITDPVAIEEALVDTVSAMSEVAPKPRKAPKK